MPEGVRGRAEDCYPIRFRDTAANSEHSEQIPKCALIMPRNGRISAVSHL